MGHVELATVTEFVTCLRPGPKFTLAMLADRAQPKPWSAAGEVECWPSVDELALRTGQSRRTVFRQLDLLEEMGLIRRHRRWVRAESGEARQDTTSYVIFLDLIRSGVFNNRPDSFEKEDDVVTSRPGIPPREKAQGAKGDKMTPLQESAGQVKGDKMTPLGGKSDNTPGLRVTPVSLLTNINKHKPSPLPPVNVSGGGLSGVGEEVFSLMDGDRLGAGAPAGGESRFGFVFDVVAQRPDGEGVFPASSVSGLGADRRLCDEVVPPGLVSGLSGRDVSRVAARVRELLAAGWSRERLRECVARRPLPERVFSPVGLVLSRLRDDVSACGDSTSEVAGVSAGGFEWRTAAGRRVKRYEVDWSRVFMVHRRALAAGETVTEHRAEFLWELTGGVVDDFLI